MLLVLKFSTDLAITGTLAAFLRPFTVSAQLLLDPEELIELVDPNGCKPDDIQLELLGCVLKLEV